MTDPKIDAILRKYGALPAETQSKKYTTNDLGVGLNKSTNEFAANVFEAVARGSKWMGQELSQPFEPETAKNVQDAFDLKNVQKIADQLNRYADSLRYKHKISLEKLKQDPTDYARFAVERVVTSLPHMAGAAAIPIPTAAAATNEILNARLKNDGKTLEDATPKDFWLAATAGVMSTLGENIATKALAKPFQRGKGTATDTLASVKKEAAKAGALQPTTEAIQSGIEYLGATVDTKKGVNAAELGDATLEGALVGGAFGAPAGVGAGVRTSITNKEITQAQEAAKAATEPQAEQTPEAQPTPEPAPQTATIPTQEAQRFTEALGMPEGLAQELTARPEPTPTAPEAATTTTTPIEGLPPLTPTNEAQATPAVTTAPIEGLPPLSGLDNVIAPEAQVETPTTTTPIDGLPPLNATPVEAIPAGKPRIRLKPQVQDTQATAQPPQVREALTKGLAEADSIIADMGGMVSPEIAEGIRKQSVHDALVDIDAPPQAIIDTLNQLGRQTNAPSTTDTPTARTEDSTAGAVGEGVSLPSVRSAAPTGANEPAGLDLGRNIDAIGATDAGEGDSNAALAPEPVPPAPTGGIPLLEAPITGAPTDAELTQPQTTIGPTPTPEPTPDATAQQTTPQIDLGRVSPTPPTTPPSPNAGGIPPLQPPPPGGSSTAGQAESEPTSSIDLGRDNPERAKAKEEVKVEEKGARVSDDIQKDIDKVENSDSDNALAEAVGDALKRRDVKNFFDLVATRIWALPKEARYVVLNQFSSADLIRMANMIDTNRGNVTPANLQQYQGLITPLARIDDIARKIAGLRKHLHDHANKIAIDLNKYIREHTVVQLGKAMHMARLQEVKFSEHKDLAEALNNDWMVKQALKVVNDPRATQAEHRAAAEDLAVRRKNLTEVYQKYWEPLGNIKGGQEMYKRINAYYKAYYDARYALLTRKVQNSKLPDESKRVLIAQARLWHEQAKDRGDYFPLARHGDYWLQIKPPAGVKAEAARHHFDRIKDRDAFAKKLAKQYGTKATDQDVFTYGSTDSDNLQSFKKDSKLLTDTLEMIDANAGKSANDLKDAVYQMYLETLPEASIRKNFLHAEKTQGFSKDVLRTFKVNATKAGNELSKLTHQDDLNNAVDAAYGALDGKPADQQELDRIFVDILASRGRDEFDPDTGNPYAQGLTKFAFIMLLTSVSSALVQPSSLAIQAMPALGARYGYGRATAELAKNMNIFNSLGTRVTTATGQTEYTWPSMRNSKLMRSNPALARAFSEIVSEYDLLQSTNTAMLMHKAATPSSLSEHRLEAGVEKGYQYATALFHEMERLTREVTFATAFNLEMKKSNNYDKAKRAGIDAIDQYLGRYDTVDRPQLFRNPVAQVVLQFKKYAMIATSFVARNAYNSLKGETPEVRAQAMKTILGAAGIGSLVFHGATGLPFFTMLTTAWDLALAGIEDEEDKKKRYKENPLTAENSAMRFKYEHMPELLNGDKWLVDTLLYGGINSTANLSISNRVGLDLVNLWFRDGKDSDNWGEKVLNTVLANLGPGPSIATTTFPEGLQYAAKGEYGRALEGVGPAFLRDIAKATRIGTEGVHTKSGKEILKKEDVSGWNIGMQAIGFGAADVTAKLTANYELTQKARGVKNARQNLLSDLNKARFVDKDKEKTQKILKKIKEHNKLYGPFKEFSITPDTVTNSAKNFMKRRQKEEQGLYLEDQMKAVNRDILKNIAIPTSMP